MNGSVNQNKYFTTKSVTAIWPTLADLVRLRGLIVLTSNPPVLDIIYTGW